MTDLKKYNEIFNQVEEAAMSVRAPKQIIREVTKNLPGISRDSWMEWQDGAMTVLPVGESWSDLDPNRGIGFQISKLVVTWCRHTVRHPPFSLYTVSLYADGCVPIRYLISVVRKAIAWHQNRANASRNVEFDAWDADPNTFSMGDLLSIVARCRDNRFQLLRRWRTNVFIPQAPCYAAGSWSPTLEVQT
jgi:hypothetical protein